MPRRGTRAGSVQMQLAAGFVRAVLYQILVAADDHAAGEIGE